MEAVECGVASLAIVLAHYGRIVPLEELRVACGVSRNGSKATNVLRAARGYGLEAKGFKKEVEKLRSCPLPAILFWNFNHFLVLEGWDAQGRIYLNDPASGPRTVTQAELDEAFTGVVLVLQPGPDFRKGGRWPSLLAAFRARLTGSETGALFALFAGLFLVVPGLLLPTFAQVFVDKILVEGDQEWFRPLLAGIGLTTLARLVLAVLQAQVLLRLETKVAVASSSRFLWHVLRLPVEFYTQRYAGEISARVGLNDRVASFLSRRLLGSLIDALMVVFFLGLMFAYDPALAVVAAAVVASLAGATELVNRKRTDASRKVLQEEGKAGGTLMAGLALIEGLKASGTESDLFARWAGYHAKFVCAHQELGAATQAFLAVPPLLTALANATVLALGGLRVMQGEMSMGMLVAFQSLMSSFLAPVSNLVSLASNVQEMQGQMNRLDDVMRYPLDPHAAEAAPADGTPRLSGEVELRAATFGYARLDPPLLTAFSLHVRAGARVALVGRSGCGKSTVARLLTGLYEPWEGAILFDGRPRREIPRRALTSALAIVDQDISLYAGTVRDNLTLWDGTVPEEALVRACKDACIHDEIVARTGGYDGAVEEGGVNFSGGQRQRLEIARALVGDPRVLVLDEATSAIDAATEAAIDRNLRRRGCTCVVIAHRLSTVRDADLILVLDRGEVVQRGTHEELMADGAGLYVQLARDA
jgi:NHLM bacteriocin system ABC transporter peptidase/ATP-binding protein